MKLLEFEAKRLLADYGLPVPAGQVVRSGEVVLERELPVVVKAQVPVGGRGRAGGVRVARTVAEWEAAREALLGAQLLGHEVSSVLAEERLEPVRELYVALALDRTEQAVVLLAHRTGGVEISETVREQGPALKLVLAGRPGR